MIALVCILGGAVIIMGVALVFARSAAQRQTEIAARALADSFAREAKAAAQKKVNDAAAADVAKTEDATHEELLRIARDLAGRD